MLVLRILTTLTSQSVRDFATFTPFDRHAKYTSLLMYSSRDIESVYGKKNKYIIS